MALLSKWVLPVLSRNSWLSGCLVMLISLAVLLPGASLADFKRHMHFFLKYQTAAEKAVKTGWQSGFVNHCQTSSLLGPNELWLQETVNGTGTSVTMYATWEGGTFDESHSPISLIGSPPTEFPEVSFSCNFGQLYTVTSHSELSGGGASVSTELPQTTVEFSDSAGNTVHSVQAVQLDNFLDSHWMSDVQQLETLLTGQVVQVNMPIISFEQDAPQILPVFSIHSVNLTSSGIVLNASPLFVCDHPDESSSEIAGGQEQAAGISSPAQGGATASLYSVQISASSGCIDNIAITDSLKNDTLTVLLTDDPYNGR